MSLVFTISHEPERRPPIPLVLHISLSGSFPFVSNDPNVLLAVILDSVDDAILTKDLDGRITYWNSGAERMYGYSAGEIVGRNVSALTPKGARERDTRDHDAHRSR